MRFRRSSLLAFALLVSTALAAAQNSLPLAHHVSGNSPVMPTFSKHELSADRPLMPAVATAEPLQAPPAHTWQLQATLPGTVIHDLSFASPAVGYAAAEAGQVWRTTNGGASWTEILNLGYPWYFYGVDALTANDVVISGIYDSSTFYGLIRWSHNGGQSWTDDIVLSPTDFLQRVRFPKTSAGLVMDLVGGAENYAQYTTDGGAGVTDWTTVVDNTDGGWFGLQYSFLPSLHARASGINFCTSLSGGETWSCGPSVDSVFDGPVFFLNDTDGWVGGGEISPSVEGWLHYTTNGGKTWSARTLDGPWPIREILFLNPKTGWASGGNVYTGVGGIYFSANGGQTWAVDATTNAEMDACDKRPVSGGYRIWCAGYTSSFTGVIYSLEIK
jgi:photosystem II stability/assembly factor-like uncharacterized protein